MTQRGFWRQYEPMSATGYCAACNVTSRDIFRHRTGADHRAAMSGIRPTPHGAHSYSPRREAARQAYNALARWDEQYDE